MLFTGMVDGLYFGDDLTNDLVPCPDDSTRFICTHEEGMGHPGKHVAHGSDGKIYKEW